MKEIEAKFYISDREKLEDRLVSMGAEMVLPRALEYNLRFDTPEGDLYNAKQLLRLRRSHTVTLTYKSAPDEVDGTSQRTEIETEVGDFQSAQMLLETLGYQVAGIYEKFRTTYQYDGLSIVVDELPYGVFVEIEGEEVGGIQQAAEKLGLDWKTNITNNYLLLFEQLQENTGIDEAELTFARFKGFQITPADLGVIPADHCD